MRPDGLRILGWIIPIVCMAISGWVLFGQNQAAGEARAKRDNAGRDLFEVQKERDLYAHLKPSARHAAEDDEPLDQDVFLNYLRGRCAQNNIRFDHYQTQNTTFGEKGNTPSDPAKAALLKGIRKIGSTMTFIGDYQSLRKLVGEFEASDRLYTLSNIVWTSLKDGTSLTMTISRYVAPADSKAKPAADKSVAPGKPGDKSPSVSTGAIKGPSVSSPVTNLNAVTPGQPGVAPNPKNSSTPGSQVKPVSPAPSPSQNKLPAVIPGAPTKS